MRPPYLTATFTVEPVSRPRLWRPAAYNAPPLPLLSTADRRQLALWHDVCGLENYADAQVARGAVVRRRR